MTTRVLIVFALATALCGCSGTGDSHFGEPCTQQARVSSELSVAVEYSPVSDCLSGYCLGTLGQSYCTWKCTSNDECPTGAICLELGDEQYCTVLPEVGCPASLIGKPCDTGLGGACAEGAYWCTEPSLAAVPFCAPVNDECALAGCGNGVIDGRELCDDGELLADGDGCSATCQVEFGWSCQGEPSVCAYTCGDGVISSGEMCDDGNDIGDDGCSSECQAEPFFACEGAPSVCVEFEGCGNGRILDNEVCDDSNTNNDDGCSAACAQENGWSCSGEPSVCMSTCGDGVVVGAEECDDDNAVGGDGCNPFCKVEVGYLCNDEPSVCLEEERCGDGTFDKGEQCDDGNVLGWDGCSAGCVIEHGWICTGAPSSCNVTCGDGIIANVEQCDDGGVDSGDGCTATCTIEQGWRCLGAPSACGCKDGYQDNDSNGICEQSCSGLGPNFCSTGSCDDSSGTPSCGCAPGTQDNDNDGICAPDCGATTCPGDVCDDSSGTATCGCLPGYAGVDCAECASGYQDNNGDGTCMRDCVTAQSDGVLTCPSFSGCSDAAGTASCLCAIFVDVAAAGGDTGANWTDAFTSLQPAIDEAASIGSCSVWVAGGTYVTFQGAADDSVRLADGVSVFGGFTSSAASFEARDWVANPTILDGGSASLPDTFVYHVLTGANDALLDGVIVRNGAALAGACATCGDGGGLIAHQVDNLSIEHVVFESNRAAFGGAIAAFSSSLTISNTVFFENVSSAGGGAVYADQGSNLVIVNTTFNGNSAARGGALGLGGRPTLANGDFETGDDTGWAPAPTGSETDPLGSLVTANAHSGASAHLLHLDGTPNATIEVYQDVAISDGASMVTAWVNVDLNPETCCGDPNPPGSYAGFDVREPGNGLTIATLWTIGGPLEQQYTTGGWQEVSADLRAHTALNEVSLVFWVRTDSNLVESTHRLFIDDIALTAAPSTIAVTNAVLWGDAGTEGPEASADAGTLQFAHCDLSGGVGGVATASGASVVDGGGNLALDPLFVAPASGDLHLQRLSPCVDAADGDVAPATDFDHKARQDDADTVNTGSGAVPYTDIGAFEYVR